VKTIVASGLQGQAIKLRLNELRISAIKRLKESYVEENNFP
jgi:hypothetical protein